MPQNDSSGDIYPVDIWLTIPKTLKYLGVSRATLYRLMEKGVLPYYRITGTRQRRFKQSDLDQLFVREDPDAISKDGDSTDDAE